MDSKDICNLQEAYLGIYAEGFKELDDHKAELVSGRHAQLASDILKNRDEVKRLSKKPFAKYRPDIKKRMRDIVSQAKHKHKLAQNASDALIKTSASKSAKIAKKIEDIKKQMPGNKIVKFNREEVEFLVSYLIGEGYATSFESAKNIAIHIGEEWAYEILKEAPYQIYGPDPHGPSDAESKPLGKPYKDKKRAKTRADKLDQEIGGYRHFVRKVDESSLADMFKAHNDELGASIKRDKERAARIKALGDKLSDFVPETERQKPQTSGPRMSPQDRISIIKSKLKNAEEIMARQDKEK